MSQAHRLTTVPEAEEGDPLDRLAAQFGDPEAELDSTIQECYLGQALADLPEGYRDIVHLRLGEGRSNEEVAQLLGTTVDSVKSRPRRPAPPRCVTDADSPEISAGTAPACPLEAGLTDARTFSNQMVEWAEAVNEDFQAVWNAIGAVSYDDPLDDTVYLDCYGYTTNYLTCTGS